MYTSLEEAKSEVWRRWNNKELRLRVEEYLDGDIPQKFQQEPIGFLARFIVTPNFEFCNFAKLASFLKISPVAGEFRSDKFRSINADKKHLGKLSIYHGENPFTCSQRAEVTEYKILDFAESEGKVIGNLNTVWGQNFVEFHHHLTDKWIEGVESVDLSDWLARHGGHPGAFYSQLLALFVCHGVQFENYHQEGHEANFTQDVVRPAFQTVANHFGVKPLIVPAIPVNSERDPAWSWYSSAIECDIKRNMTRPDAKTKAST